MAHKSDPRTIITPYAFNVAPELLGIPLASPFQRLIALLIDLMLIVLLTNTGALPLGIAAVIFFIWGSTRRGSRAALGKLFRVMIGCFGFVALSVTVLVVWAMNFVGSEEGQELITVAGITSGVTVPAEEEGEVELTPDQIIDAALAAIAPEPTEEEREAVSAVATLTLDEALTEYGARIRSGDTLRGGAARVQALRERIQSDVAADTLATLGERIQDQRLELLAAEAQLEEAQQGSGLLRLMRDLLDETFLAFGWGTIYFTLFLTVLNGQTPGKKAMGIRVVLIDNKPLSWWASFERVGGYAAGLATGLLGFAQVFWDANRQAIHDKVSETVVIKTGVERVAGPWMRRVEPEAPPLDPSSAEPGGSG